ncbi:MAG: cytochrome b/b6 domain-containing protein [Rhodobacteraceae bacterium]|nr:cytochrome b/b6 domain-containing protein [Paracoccaceae bacterium]
MTSATGYLPAQIRLHWLAAILIVLQVVLHEPMAEAWEALGEGRPVTLGPAIAGHVAGGLLILAFALWRLVLRIRRGAPPPPAGPAVLRLLAGLAHLALYALMVVMPLSGAAAWFFGVAPAAAVHVTLVPALIALVLMHAAAALWHHFWRQDESLLRMLRPGR